jgi:filamentous hemagglutinin family protein
MNRVYRVIWSKALCSWVVVCELTRRGGKAGGSRSRKLRRSGLLTVAGAVLMTAALADPATNALPSGGQITAGQAAISQTGNTLTVQQASDKAIINWQSFDVGAQAAVRFSQPSTDSVALNRVQAQSPSQIFGKLTANGQVFLLNASGVIFGPEAKVDVGGIVAGAMKITDEDFLAGRYIFTDGKGVVTNKGTITASDGGMIALLAPEVRNEGIIRARLGTIVLAAGEAITLTNSASGITVVIDKGAFNALVHNGNLVAAEDGRVFMSARAADTLQRAVIRNTGVIEAHNARRVGSVIRLEADSVDNSGTIDASGTTGGSVAITAGDITNTGKILGGEVRLAAANTAHNDGEIGGRAVTITAANVSQSAAGAIRAEGDQSGGTITIAASENTTLAGTVDASSAGTGGEITVTSPHTTIANATLDASGEVAGGSILLKPVSPRPNDDPLPDPSTLLINNAVLSTASRRGLGGLIDISASDVTVDNGASLLASGQTGGTIFVGGHWQGGDGAFQATHTTIGATVLLDTSATGPGDGGVIAAWSNVHDLGSLTTVSGTLRSASTSGTGGRIETSGHVVNTDGIAIDASSALGNGGLWLLDPYDYTIGSTQAGYISTALTAGTSVTITTASATNTETGNTITGTSSNGDITVSSAITKSGGGTATLTLRADRNITISSGATITSSSGKLNINLSADNAGSATVGGISLGANLSSNGGTILIGGAAGSTYHGIAYARNQTSSTPAVALQANVAITSNGGDVTINGTTTGTATSYSATKGGIYFLSGSSISTNGGNIYLSGISTGDSKEFGIGFEANAGTTTTLSVGGTSGQIFIEGQNTVNSLGALGMAQNGQKSNIVFAAPSVAAIIISVNGVLQTSTFTFGSNCDATFQNCGLQQVDGGNNSYLYASYRAVSMATHAFYVSTSTGSKTYDGTTTASGLTLTTTAAPSDYSTSGLSFATSSKNVGTYTTLTPSGTYATGFHSGVTGYDYAIGYFYNPYTINAKAITAITGLTAANKQYDGATTATLNTGSAAFTGMIGGDSLTVASGTGSFATKAVGTGKTVSITGLTLGGTDAGNYTLSSSTASASANITAKVLTIGGLTIQNKTYDGTTTASFSGTPSLSGVLGGETVNLSGTASAAFADKNAGTGKAVTVTGLSLSGTDAGNYTLIGSTSSATADITAATISAITGITAANKTYDGTTAATLNTGAATFTGKIAGDTLTVATGSGTFADKNAANGKTVTITGLTVGGADAGNYTLSSSTAATSANITAATITAITGITAANKTYDGNATATLTTSGASFTGKIAGDTLTVASATGAFGDKTAANGKTVNINGLTLGGTDAGNYTLAASTASTTANIAAKVLTITGVSVNNKVYDGTTTATLSGAASLSGVIGSDDVSASGSATANFADKNVGTGKTVDISGLTLSGADAGNYTMSGSTASATANITAATISAITGITAANKTYDATTAASLVTSGAGFTGKISGDSLTVASSTGTFADKNAADGKTVTITGLTLGGADAGNYTLSSTTATTTANISKAAISAITGITAANKTYDGTTAATLDNSAATFSGKISGDTLTVASGNGTFADKNAADGKTVTIAGLTLGGTDAGNYTLASATASTTANISRAAISAISGVTAANKTYDGTTAATLDNSAATFSGKISGDTLTVASGTGSFADKAAADGKTVSITGLTLGGADAGNYTLSTTTASTTANIAKAAISAITGIAAANKTYDGTTAATLDNSAAAFTGKISGDSLTVASSTGAFADKTAADGKTVSITGLSLGGTDVGNYTLSSTTASATANIAKAAISAITGLTAINKTYDGTATATIDTSAASFTGKISGDTLTVASGTGAFADKAAADGKTVTITSLTLGGTDAGNYTLSTTTASTTANISKATISAIAGITASNKIYDGTTAASLNTGSAAFTGKISGDTLTVASGSGAFADKAAADGKTVAITGLTLGGTDAGNYTLSSTTGSATANIAAKVLTITGVSINNKVYDGTTAATLSGAAGLSGVIGSDDVSASGSAIATFADKNVGDGKTVDIAGLTLSGTDAGNYSLTGSTASATANITKATISAITGITASNKTYDGTTAASLVTTGASFTGKISGDTLTVASGTGAFADRNAADGKTVTISGLTLGGTDAGNYTLSGSTGSTTANIIKAAITAIGGVTAANKTYDGTTAATLNTSGATFTGKIGGDTLTVASGTGAFADKNAGDGKTVTITGLTLGGTDAVNYTLSLSTGSTTANITKTTISAITGIAASNKTYDGTTAATLDTASAGFTGKISGDSLTIASGTGTFADKNAGDGKTVTISGLTLGGTDAGNYTLSAATTTTTANISAKSLTITGISVANKVYDGTTTATLSGTPILSGIIGSDDVSASGATSANFADKNAGDGKTVTITGLTLGGADASNYSLAGSTASATANITKATITAVGGIAAANKTYDGTTAATLDTSGATFTGKIGGDTLTLSGATGTFADKNAGDGKTVTITGLSLGGADANNYTLTGTTAATTADIAKAMISSVTGITAQNKTYDGTTSATLITTDAAFTGKITGDALTLSGATGTFADKNAGDSKTVTITGLTLGGADAGNYTLAIAPISTSANIVAKSLSISGVTAANKIYDGTTAATLTGAAILTGLVGSDDVELSGAAAANFADKNAGNGKTVTISGLTLAGADAANYFLTNTTATTTANIAKAAVSVIGGLVAQSKTYDGTTTATLNTGTVVFTGLVAGDTLTIGSASGTFADKNAGNGKTVSITGLTLGGADAGNYSLANTTAGTAANITPAVLHITSTPVTKTYDGTTAASGTLVLADGTQLYGGDSLSGGTFVFNDKNAGTKTLTVSGVTVSDGNNGGNYTVLYIANTASTITKAAITAITGVTAGNKTYDGTTGATLNTGSAAFTGRIAGDSLTLGPATASFADKNAGTGKTITVTGLTLGGADAANYTIAFAAFTTTANIAAKPLTVTGATVASKTFDNTDTATINGAILNSADIISGDQVSLANQSSGTFANNGPATGIAVSTAMTLIGSDAVNYVLTQPSGLTGDINATQSAPRQPDTTAVAPVAPATITTPAATSTNVTVPAPAISADVTVAAAPATPAPAATPATYVLTTTSTAAPAAPAAGGATAPQDSQGFTSVRNFDTLSMNSGSSFAFTLPTDTFKHSDSNASISLSATTQSGSPLPDWVRFSSDERRFTGTAPDGLSELKLVVTARDQLGNEATTTITLHFGADRKVSQRPGKVQTRV